MCKKVKIFFSLVILLMIIIFTQRVNAQILYYPVGGISTYGSLSILVSPPAPTTTGTLPYNLYYPFGQPPGIPVYPPAPISTVSAVTPTLTPSTAYNPITAIGSTLPSTLFSPIVAPSGAVLFNPLSALYFPFI